MSKASNDFISVLLGMPRHPSTDPPIAGCAALAAERPQLVVTNLMVASAMLSCLWAVIEQGSVPYSEVYLDVVHNAARSRSWFRVPAGAP